MKFDWKTAVTPISLGDLVEVVIDYRGKTPKKLGGNFTEKGVPVISAIHLKRGRIIWKERERFVSPEMFHKWMKEPLRKNDVLLTSEAPLGEVALVPSDAALVLSQRLFAIRCNPELLDSNFLLYFFQSPLGQNELYRRASGSTVVGIRHEELLNVKIPLLPIEKQKTVGKVLNSIDSKICTNEILSKTLEDIAQAIFKSWFIDFDPVRAKMVGEKPAGMDAATAALFPDSMEESELGLVPKGWEVSSPGLFCPFKYGKALPAPNRIHGDIPVYGSNGIVGTHNLPLLDNSVIVIGRKGTVGTVNLELSPCWIIDTAFYARTIESENIYLAFLQLKNLELNKMNSDGAVPGLNRENVHRLQFTVATHSVRQSFASVAKAIFLKRKMLQEQAKNLIEIRDSLLPRLISGELQIPEEMTAT